MLNHELLDVYRGCGPLGAHSSYVLFVDNITSVDIMLCWCALLSSEMALLSLLSCCYHHLCWCARLLHFQCDQSIWVGHAKDILQSRWVSHPEFRIGNIDIRIFQLPLNHELLRFFVDQKPSEGGFWIMCCLRFFVDQKRPALAGMFGSCVAWDFSLTRNHPKEVFETTCLGRDCWIVCCLNLFVNQKPSVSLQGCGMCNDNLLGGILNDYTSKPGDVS